MLYVRKCLLWLCSFPDCPHFGYCASMLSNITGLENTKQDFEEAPDVCKALVDAFSKGEGVIGREIIKSIRNLLVNKIKFDKVMN